MESKVICQERIRQLPARFSWMDQRFVREGHLKELGAESACLYLFLVTVGDRNGVSWYSSSKIVELSAIADLESARGKLISHGLIAWKAPYYQVLELPREAGLQEKTERFCEPVTFSDVLKAMAASDEHKSEGAEILNEGQLSVKLREVFGNDQ